MISDAMNAGVNPGGLQSRTEIRVLICYILHNLKEPIELERLKERLHFEGIANYFEIAFAISDLEENGNIVVDSEENGAKFYVASGDCDNIVSALGNSVPFSIRERSLDIADQIVSRRRNERSNKVDIEKTKNGVYVTCSVMEKDAELVAVKLLVPDDESALIIKENFLNNPMLALLNATNGLLGTKI